MGATYELDEIRELIRQDKFYVIESALETAASAGFLQDDITECVVDHMTEAHFYKTMCAAKVVGLMQDVYRLKYQGQDLYVKVQINNGGNAVIISFKPDENV